MKKKERYYRKKAAERLQMQQERQAETLEQEDDGNTKVPVYAVNQSIIGLDNEDGSDKSGNEDRDIEEEADFQDFPADNTGLIQKS